MHIKEWHYLKCIMRNLQCRKTDFAILLLTDFKRGGSQFVRNVCVRFCEYSWTD